MTDQAPNIFYAKGRKLYDGDQILISLVPLTDNASEVFACFKYTVYV